MVICQQKGLQVLVQLVRGLVVMQANGGLFQRAVEALHLPVGPGVGLRLSEAEQVLLGGVYVYNSALFPPMKKILLLELFLLGLASCSPSPRFTAADGMKVYGPEVPPEESMSDHHTLRYSVVGFNAPPATGKYPRPGADEPAVVGYDARTDTGLGFLRAVAYIGVAGDDNSGTYEVIFTDQVSGKVITQLTFSARADLLGLKEILPLR